MPPKSIKFQTVIPDKDAKSVTIGSKTIAAGSFKIYSMLLNRLAKAGILNAADILNDQDAVIDIIKKSDEVKQKQRQFLSAVLFATADIPEEQKSKLRKFQETINEFPAPGTVMPNGSIWMSKEDFVAKQKAPLAGAGFSFINH